jgi:type I restriction enzyme S subunit
VKWKSSKLSEVALIIMGQSPPSNSYNNNGQGLPLFQGKAEFGYIHPKPSRWCTEPTRVAEANDILMSVRAPVGPTNIADITCCIGRGLAAIRCKQKNALYKYVYWYLKSIENSISGLGQGSTFKAINRATIESISIPLPPIEEQRRIAAILDKADEIRRKRQEAIALTDELLRSTFLEMFGDPVTNPMEWEVEALSRVLKVLHRYPTFYGCDYIQDGIPVIKIGSVDENGIVDTNLSHYDKVTTDFSNKFPKTIVKANDLVMAVRGDTTGKIGIIPLELAGANISPNLIRLSPDTKKCQSKYLFWVLHYGRALIENRINDTAKKSLTATTLKEVPIPVPPVSKQNEFKRFCEKADLMGDNQAYSRTTSNNLFNSLLQKAFKGEL